jgi:hypothetical protein
MSATTSDVDPAEITPAEIAYLTHWGQANKLAVTVESAGTALADEVALVDAVSARATWTMHRAVGHLWLSLREDPAVPDCRGWTVAVGSVEEATSRIADASTRVWH